MGLGVKGFLIWMVGSGFWEFYPKAAALAGGGFKAELAAHAGNRFTDDGQAGAGAVVGAAVQAFKEAKDALVVFGGDADAVVFEPEADGVGVGFGAEADMGTLAGGDEAEGIAQEVGE